MSNRQFEDLEKILQEHDAVIYTQDNGLYSVLTLMSTPRKETIYVLYQDVTVEEVDLAIENPNYADNGFLANHPKEKIYRHKGKLTDSNFPIDWRSLYPIRLA